MKKSQFLKLLCIVSVLLANNISAKRGGIAPKGKNVGVNKTSWLNKVTLARSNAFVQNVGQFDNDLNIVDNKDILFREDEPSMSVYFTTKGIIYKVSKREKVSEKEWASYSKINGVLSKEDDDEPKYINKTTLVVMKWSGASDNIQLSPEEKTDYYFNYYRPDLNRDKIFGNVSGYKKIIYKNVYPNIDVEYSIHSTEGIKYSYVLHPGADISMIKMSYEGADVSKDETGNVILTDEFGTIIDHAPSSYQLADGTGRKNITSSFSLNNNVVGFTLGNMQKLISQTTVIDPWVVGSAIPGFNASPDDIAVDGANNIIIYGNANSISNVLQKYNAAGVLQWTFNLTTRAGYATYQGDVQSDAAGNIYTTIGLSNSPNNYNTIKINPTGTSLIWGSATPKPSTNKIYETWSLAFNCDQSMLVQSGGGISPAPTTSVDYNISVYEPIDINTGAEDSLMQNPLNGEITCSMFGPNGMLYHLLSDSNIAANSQSGSATGPYNYVMCVNPSAAFAKVFVVNTGYSYRDGDMKEPGSIGYNGLGASCKYLYTSDGLSLDQRNLTTGALIKRITIPGGSNFALSSGTGTPLVNSGIVTDKCGNVYVGTANKIIQYDENLNKIDSLGTLPGVVFDMAIGTNNQLFCCGAPNASGTTSFVAEFDLPSCGGTSIAYTPSICEQSNGSATVTADTFCIGPYNYLWSPSGQTTQTAVGLSPGIYTVNISPQSGCSSYITDTITIRSILSTIKTSISNITMATCGNSNGSAIVSATGGIGPLTYNWSPTGGANDTANNLMAGIYTVTVTDSLGC